VTAERLLSQAISNAVGNVLICDEIVHDQEYCNIRGLQNADNFAGKYGQPLLKVNRDGQKLAFPDTIVPV
jgi:hypothetical protein